ncbi:MAG: hypothetical protein ACP5ER_04365 [Candidatus Bathyarchaeales archaeon]
MFLATYCIVDLMPLLGELPKEYAAHATVSYIVWFGVGITQLALGCLFGWLFEKGKTESKSQHHSTPRCLG